MLKAWAEHRRGGRRSSSLGTVAVVEDAQLVLLAVAAAERWQISLWDALIVEAARRAGAATLLSEDLQHGMDFDGVLVENPFAKL